MIAWMHRWIMNECTMSGQMEDKWMDDMYVKGEWEVGRYYILHRY